VLAIPLVAFLSPIRKLPTLVVFTVLLVAARKQAAERGV